MDGMDGSDFWNSTEDWGALGAQSAPYPSAPAMSPQSLNPSSGSWESLLRDGIKAASSVYIAREQIQAGQAANAGRGQSSWALPLPPGTAGTGQMGGGNMLPLLLIGGAVVVALLLMRGG